MLRSVALGTIIVFLTGVQTVAQTASESLPQSSDQGAVTMSSNDQWIGFNRALYDFNIGFDKISLKPTARLYRRVMPEKAKTGVTNFVHNLQEPVNFINLLLQGKPNKAFSTFGRFLVNTTVGFGGLRDLGTPAGMPRYHEDFGQTMAVWGVPSGPYLMLPFLGPSNPRDFLGFIVEFIGDPMSMTISREVSPWASRAATATYFLDVRQRALLTVDKVLETSTDPYVALRSAYIQRRTFNIADGVEAPATTTTDPFEDGVETPVPTNDPVQPLPKF
jgi:phospholipid-binding lipoprotein MlaA